MPTLDKIDIELIGIGRALLNKNLAVPMYQRSYAWEEKHVIDFFQDISKAISEGDSEYFLGSIVTTKNDTTRPEVADGQQRLATTTILLAAIRDSFYNTDDKARASTIASTYLYKQDLATLAVIPKLKLNENDNDFFLKRILCNPDDEDRAILPSKPSHNKINNAAILAKNHISSISNSSESTAKLAQLVDYIADSLRVIWVSVSDDSNAFTIFETLNDRGLSLAISDLLKNYLFGIAGDRLPEVQQKWLSTVGTLESIDNEEMLVTFIRHWWSSKYGLVREKDLYEHIKKRVRNKQQAVEFASEISKNAILYVAILNTGHEIWQNYGPTAKQHMETLNLMRMIQIRPLLLSIFDKFSTNDIKKSLRMMVSWVVRFLITGGLGGGTLENHYSQRAKEIRDGNISSANDLVEKLTNIIPNDSQFKTAFTTATVSKQYLARYYLRVLENQAKGETDPELIPNDNQEIVNLEHILPQSPSSTWNHISDEDQATHMKRLGNLALMQIKINTEAGNDSFSFKKPFFSKSHYVLTSMVNKNDSWDTDAINSRQVYLADLAIKAWPLK
ncbi:MAG: DUF262 domain-containing HNH endonuclease family protein [Candidatus Thiodiazotropha sp. (ex Clathrolucina costata)]|nr:DUF262 domain-containing HNH endonuclease family protein [Candidatus Thiodiazotropha taylori]